MGFTRKIEDFICGHCGREVKGDGYTNHCPYCLWSKHVDIDPGDRAAECDGLMKPIDIYLQNQRWVVVHRCEDCNYKSKNKIDIDDDFDEIIKLERKINEKKVKG